MRVFIYVIIFFSFFDLFTQLPVMSTFAESVGASAFITGLAVGMYSFSNTIGNILSGFWTDRKGPFYVLLTGLITTSLSLFMYYLIQGPVILLIVRFIHGFVAGLVVPAAFTFLANTTDKEKRGKGSAISGAFVGISAILGPAFSGIIASRTSVPFVFSITGSCVFLLFFTAYFSLRKVSSTHINNKNKTFSSKTSVLYYFRNIGVLKAFTGAFFLMFSQGVIAYLLPLHVQSLQYDSKLSGMLLSIFGIVAVLIFILPTNRIFDKVHPVYTLSIGIFLMGCSQLLLSVANMVPLLYIAMILYGIGFGFLFPSINSLLIDSTNNETRGKAYGYFYAFFSLGVVVGSSLLGALPFTINQGFLFTGILLILFALLVFLARNNKITFN